MKNQTERCQKKEKRVELYLNPKRIRKDSV